MVEHIIHSRDLEIEPDRSEWSNIFPLLTVALGLSYRQYHDPEGWDDSQYTPGVDEESLVHHPINEGYYIRENLLSH